jgi:hypothetical protein
VLLTVLGGTGIILYLTAWLVLPEETDSDQLGERIVRRLRSSRFVPLVLIGIAVVVLLSYFSSLGSPVIWALALLAMGVVLLREEPEYEPVVTRPAPATTEDAVAKPERVRRVRTRRPRSPLLLYTLGATCLMLALAAALTGVGTFDVDIADHIGLALAGVGTGIIVSAWWGRSVLLKLLGIALIPALLVASIIDVPVKGSWGGRYVVAVRDDPSGKYEVLAGTVTFLLERYQFGDEPVVIDASVVAGSFSVMLPPGVTVRLESSVDAGRIVVFDKYHEGADLRVNGTFREPGSSKGELVLKVRGGAASVSVASAEWIEQEIQMQREEEALRQREERRLRREARHDRIRRAQRRARERNSDG